MIKTADAQEEMSLVQALSQVSHTFEAPEGQRIDSSIAAVITVENDTRYFADTLRAVMHQTVLPGRILIVDCSDDAEKNKNSHQIEIRAALDKLPSMGFVVTASGRSFGEVVTHAVNQALDSGMIASSVEYMWLLHDDSRPLDNTYVDMLNEVRHNNASATIIGAKQLSWDGEVLSNVGYFAQSGHRVTSLVVTGEIDQDQYDFRQDVYAVSLTGAFIRISDWMRLGGFSAAMGTFGQSRDFCRRVARSGGRVIVEPRARIAHRAARFEGVRTHHGSVHECDPEDLRTFKNNAFSVMTARDAYYYSDVHPLRWIYLWPLSLIVAIVRAASGFIHKQPYEALCELVMPWYNLSHFGSIASVRSALSGVQKLAPSKLGTVTATSDQLRTYKDRTNDLFAQQNRKVVSPLIAQHLRTLFRERYTWLLVTAFLVFLTNIVVNIEAVRGLFNGEHLVSSTLVSTASTTQQLFETATTPYTFGNISGVDVPPSPFLLVYAIISLLTFGHAWVTSAIIVLLAPPAAAMSMWALSGIFTRSNIARVSLAVAWVASGFVTGIFVTGHLSMMLVYVFLPAGVAFAAKALGVYQSEEPIESEPSIQASACAALCFAIVSASEPQLFLAMLIIGVVMAVIYRRHVIMLLSMCIPSLMVLAPTIWAVIQKPATFTQLFASGVWAHNAPSSVVDTFMPSTQTRFGMTMAVLCTVALVVLVAMAVISLAVPSLVKTSRSMWIGIVSGFVLAVVAPHIAIGVNATGVQFASVLPAAAVVMMCLLTGLAMMSGPAKTQFIPVLTKDKNAVLRTSETAKTGENADPAVVGQTHPASRTAFAVSRAFVVAVCALLTVTWAVGTTEYFTQTHDNVTSSASALPIVAQEYLKTSEAHRVLVVQLNKNQSMDYAVLPSAHGDIILSSAALDSQRALSNSDLDTESHVEHAIAQLAENNNDDAIEALSDAGFGGIYVVYSDAETEYSSFVSHASASNNTELVANTDQGVYIRISIKASADQGVNMEGFNAAHTSPLRYVWLALLIIVGLMYVTLGLPRFFARGEK
ncbi:glycosyltransferase family 2 protein [Alloscardovia criceti]|uniref:glycosyltransferase family 2 protein n=1 Tax=Alloscardovia criceti TaxID=356828 RepID=UPI0003A2445A|nr:hypothetical protein [Alloscardovia criceti]